MTFNSSEVASGDQALASQYNDLRDDTLFNAGDFGTTTGTANVRALTIDSAITSLTLGLKVRFKSNTSNSGATTINVNGIGATTIKKGQIDSATQAVDLETNDLTINGIHEIVYDGTNFILITTSNQISEADAGILTDASDASDLHKHAIATGAQTITVNSLASSQIVNIAHGLSSTPNYIEIDARHLGSSSNGSKKDSSYSIVYTTYANTAGFYTSYVILLNYASSSVIDATVTTDGTNIILSINHNVASSVGIQLKWKAQKT